MIKFRNNLGWRPNDEKQNEQRINWARTYDVVPMMGNQTNKQETYIEPRMVSQWWEKKLRFNLDAALLMKMKATNV